MPFAKELRQIDRLEHFSRYNINSIPIVLTDSKGRYLEDEVYAGIEQDIIWWANSAECKDQYDFLVQNLEGTLRQYPNKDIVLYIWLGTCDLTVKEGRFIYLRSKHSDSVRTVTNCFRDIYNFVRQFSRVRCVFLEIPPYSIYNWNWHHRRGEYLTPAALRGFRRDDKTLNRQVEEVNKFVRDTNRILHKNSPKFSLDLAGTRAGREEREIRFYYRFQALYIDGVHPCPVLSRLWLLQLVKLMSIDCA